MYADRLMAAGQTNGFQTARLSDAGGRPNNEDFCALEQVDKSTCWVVADGLGGHNGGELASRTAAESVLQSFCGNPEVSSSALERHIAAAQEAILQLQQKDPAVAQMRTTLVALISDSRQALWAHVGDSRLYRFQAGGLMAQTEDHSVPQSLVKAGEIQPDQIRGHPDRNRLLRSLGEPGPARASVVAAPALLRDADAFLLCTDGFWEYVFEIEMLADLSASASPAQWLDRCASRLRKRARGEYDNYSAIAVFYESGHADGTTVEPRDADRPVSVRASREQQRKPRQRRWLRSRLSGEIRYE
jgi:PPM family protein phosphatase